MLNRRCILTIVLSGLIGASFASESYRNHKVYLVHARAESDLNLLHNLESDFTALDFWDRIHRVANTSYRVMVPPEVNEQFVNALSENHIENRVIIDDVAKVLEAGGKPFRGRSGSCDFKHFWTYSEVNAYLNYLAKTYANYTKVSVIGKSGEGRKIRSIHITGNKRCGKSKTILVDATIHAREWISTMMALYIIQELVENREDNLKLLSDIDWVIVPIVNPDGYVYSHENNRFWRKTRTINAKTSCVGVDPNRNFDFHWDTPEASSTSPCNAVYRGPKPNSIPEVVNLSKFLRQYPNSKLYLTLHSYGGYLLYPYGYDSVSIEHSEEHQKLGNLMREKIYRKGGPRYKVGNSASLLYPASGGSDDYAVGVAKIPFAFTMELPRGGSVGFDIPASRISSVVSETFAGIKVFGDFFENKC